MSNEEIKNMCYNEEELSFDALLDLARADERAKYSAEIADLQSEIERLNNALESRKTIMG